MISFDLNIAFTDAQLETIFATRSNVVVAKPTLGETPNVAWQVFKPLQANTLTWTEEYGIYASTMGVRNGAVLKRLSATPVPSFDAQLYTLLPSGAMSDPAPGGQRGSFTLLNEYANQPFMTIGLYQDATVNGTEIAGNAISAAPVLLQSTAVMTPFTTVFIWLQSRVVSNTVITKVTSPMTPITFGGEVDTVSVAYDSNSGKFLPTREAA